MWSPLWSAMWSNGGFLEKRETGKCGKSEVSCAFAGFAFGLRAALRTRTQIRHATNCATPGRRQIGRASFRSRDSALPYPAGSTYASPIFLSKSKRELRFCVKGMGMAASYPRPHSSFQKQSRRLCFCFVRREYGFFSAAHSSLNRTRMIVSHSGEKFNLFSPEDFVIAFSACFRYTIMIKK